MKLTEQELEACKPSVRLGRGGAAYSVRQLFDFLALSIHLRNSKRMKIVLQTAFHLASGSFADYLATASADGMTLDGASVEKGLGLGS